MIKKAKNNQSFKTSSTMLSIVLVLVLVISTSFAFFISINKISNDNINANVALSGRPIFTSSKTKDNINMDIVLNMESTTEEVAGTDNIGINVGLTTSYGSGHNISCTYDIVFTWDSSLDQYEISSGTTKEYTYSVTVDNNLVKEEAQLPNYSTSATTLYTGTITNDGTGITKQNIVVDFKFYRGNYDQSSHVGKNYGTNINVSNVVCGSSTSGTVGENYKLLDALSVNAQDASVTEESSDITYGENYLLNYGNYGIRFVGQDPDNYVLFNCSDYDNASASTCDLWRIVGIFDDTEHGVTGKDLIKITTDNAVDLESYNIVSGTEDYIQTARFNYATSELNGESATITVMSIYNKYQEGNTESIGFGLSAADYLFATSGSSSASIPDCLGEYTGVWDSTSACATNDWLYYSNGQVTPYEVSFVFDNWQGEYRYYVGSDGILNLGDDITSAKPVVYLKDDVYIVSGDGTRTNPYKIKIDTSS